MRSNNRMNLTVRFAARRLSKALDSQCLANARSGTRHSEHAR